MTDPPRRGPPGAPREHLGRRVEQIDPLDPLPEPRPEQEVGTQPRPTPDIEGHEPIAAARSRQEVIAQELELPRQATPHMMMNIIIRHRFGGVEGEVHGPGELRRGDLDPLGSQQGFQAIELRHRQPSGRIERSGGTRTVHATAARSVREVGSETLDLRRIELPPRRKAEMKSGRMVMHLGRKRGKEPAKVEIGANEQSV
jgi:hypothetical protein